MGMVTFYAYYLMMLVLDHYEKVGRCHIRFHEIAADVLVEPTKPIYKTKAYIRRAIDAEDIPYTYVVSHYFSGHSLATLAQLGASAHPSVQRWGRHRHLHHKSCR